MSTPTTSTEKYLPIAPVWHTCCIVVLVGTLSALSVYLRMGTPNPRIDNVPLYLMLIAIEWFLFAFTLWKSDGTFKNYVARVLRNPRSLLLDVPVALVLSAITFFLGPLMIKILGPNGWGSAQGILPNDGLERALWIVLSISAGICEETVFRGYLQQQLTGWTGHLSAGIFGQAIIFGLGHGYQGWKSMTLIAVLGFILGIAVWLRKGLRANMIAHALVDSVQAFSFG